MHIERLGGDVYVGSQDGSGVMKTTRGKVVRRALLGGGRC